MTRLYGDYPHAWGRVKSIDQTPAQYACSVERVGGTDYSPRWYAVMAAIAAVTAFVIVWLK